MTPIKLNAKTERVSHFQRLRTAARALRVSELFPGELSIEFPRGGLFFPCRAQNSLDAQALFWRAFKNRKTGDGPHPIPRNFGNYRSLEHRKARHNTTLVSQFHDFPVGSSQGAGVNNDSLASQELRAGLDLQP